jgi:hypothetical protein
VAAEEDAENCSFCESTRSASFNSLLNPFVDGVRFAYEDVLNVLSYVSSEEGFVGGSSIDTWDLLHEELFEVFDNSEISDHLYSGMDDRTWVRRGEPRRDVDDVLRDAWGRFCHEIKHETRYVFWWTQATVADLEEEETYGEVGPTRVLFHVGNSIEELDLFTHFKEGKELFRARTYSKPPAIPWKAGDLGTPPLDRSRQGNRMSPAGIPMFYGAESLDVAMAEVSVRTEDRQASAGRFTTTRSCRVVDLTKLPSIPQREALERTIRAGGEVLNDRHSALVALSRELARQMDDTGLAGGPSTRLSAACLSALKDLGRVLGATAVKERSGGKLSQLRALQSGKESMKAGKSASRRTDLA